MQKEFIGAFEGNAIMHGMAWQGKTRHIPLDSSNGKERYIVIRFPSRILQEISNPTLQTQSCTPISQLFIQLNAIPNHNSHTNHHTLTLMMIPQIPSPIQPFEDKLIINHLPIRLRNLHLPITKPKSVTIPFLRDKKINSLVANLTTPNGPFKMPIPITSNKQLIPALLGSHRLLHKQIHRNPLFGFHNRFSSLLPAPHQMQRCARRLTQEHLPPTGLFIQHSRIARRQPISRKRDIDVPAPMALSRSLFATRFTA